MSVLTDLIYGGSNAVAGLTEGAVNDAIANANDAADNANNMANHPPYVGEDLYWYIWNNETKSYDKTDKYSKGSFDYPTFDVVEGRLIACITEGDTDRFKLSDEGHLLVAVN